jgi:hypothetical protein
MVAIPDKLPGAAAQFNALSKEILTSEPLKQALIAALFCAVTPKDKLQKVKRERYIFFMFYNFIFTLI